MKQDAYSAFNPSLRESLGESSAADLQVGDTLSLFEDLPGERPLPATAAPIDTVPVKELPATDWHGAEAARLAKRMRSLRNKPAKKLVTGVAICRHLLASLEEASLEEASLEEASLEEASLEEASVEEASVEEASVEEASVDEASVEGDATHERAAVDTGVSLGPRH